MSTKLNAEELAAMRFPTSARKGRLVRGYAEAIREVAQPIADERDELRKALESQMRWFDDASESPIFAHLAGFHKFCKDRADGLLELLAKYPKP